jgi:uncharacterized protein (TIGR02246 family)
MRKVSLGVNIACGLMGSLVFAAAGAQAEDVKAAIKAANAQMEALFGKGDAAGVAALYAADGQVLPVGMEPVQGADSIAKFWQGAMGSGIAAVTLTTVELYPAGSTATEVGQYALADKTGKNIDHGKYIVIWKKSDGKWKLLRDMFSTNVAPKK